MAKRSSARRAAHLAPYQFTPRAAAPVVVYKTRTVHAKPKKRGHRRHGGGGLLGGMGGSGLVGRAAPYAIGGAICGYLDKQTTLPLPTIPMLGKMGSIALAAWFFSKGHGIIGEVAKAASVLAGYQLGKDGKVSGEEMHGVGSEI